MVDSQSSGVNFLLQTFYGKWVMRIESEVFVGVDRFATDTLNSPVPLCTHLNQERANVYPFHAQG